MKLLKIPDDIDKFNLDDNYQIDMSKLNFENDENELYHALICLRNTGTKLKLNFDDCTYDMKEQYLKLFLSSNIDIYSKQLSSTWIEILTYEIDNSIYGESILFKNEIEKFITNNYIFINKVRRLINSLPYLALYKYTNLDKIGLDMSDVIIIDDNEIKLMNLYQLTEYDSFILLLDDNEIPERVGGYYKMFDDKSNEYNVYRLLKNLPFFNILSTLFGTSEMQSSVSDKFLNKIQIDKGELSNGITK